MPGQAGAPGPSGRLDGLRVLAFCDYYTERSSGGAERVATEVYERLAAAGAEIRLLSATDHPKVSRQLTVVPVPAWDLSRIVGGQLCISPQMWRTAGTELRQFRPQVLQTHSLHFHCSVVSATLARRSGVPLVTTAHVAGVERVEGLLGHLTDLYERSIGRFVLNSSAAVIAVSEPVAEHVVGLGASPSRVTVVPNGVDHATFAGEPASIAADPVVIFVGRLIANKGPQVLLEAAARLRHRGTRFRLRFVGDGPLRASLEADARRFGLEQCVEFTGHVTDVASHLRQASIVVRPSFSEGMPLTVLEAMAAGRCVVASDLAANRAILSEGSTGALFPTGRPDALATTLQALLEHPQEVARLAEAGRRSVQDLTWEATADGHAAVLTRVAASHAGPFVAGSHGADL